MNLEVHTKAGDTTKLILYTKASDLMILKLGHLYYTNIRVHTRNPQKSSLTFP